MVAFALLGVGTAAYMVSRSPGIGPAGTLMARGVLQAREPIIVADFGSPADDSLLAGTVTDALRIDLSQSTAVKIMSDESVTEGLQRMGRQPGERLDESLSRELAQREGVGAMVVGDVNRAGLGYVLTARLLSVDGGETLASARETAEDSTRVIAAIDELSASLRERIGESLRSIRGSPPLERVTTSSLQALRRYSLALRADQVEGDANKAQALLEEAIALDTAFAMAHRKLGVILSNQDRNPAREAKALRSAFAHRDRLTERERYMTMASYYAGVTGENERAAAALESLLELDPDDFGALNNLAIIRMQLGEFEEARTLLDRALVAEDSSGAVQWQNLISLGTLLRDWEAAETTLATARRMLPEQRRLSIVGVELAGARADYELGVERALRHGEQFGAAQTDVEYNLANLEVARGRLAEAERHRRASSALAVTADREPRWALLDLLDLAAVDIYVRERPGRGLLKIDSALARYPLQDFEVENRPYLPLAPLYADAGRVAGARELLNEYERVVPVEIRRGEHRYFEQTRARVAAADGRPGEAIPTLRRHARRPLATWWPDLALGDIYDRAGQADSARAAYTRYLLAGGIDRYYADWLHRARILERLAELHDAAGNADEAIRYYAMFTEQWADADPELQPRVQRARERLEALLAERG